MKLQLSAKLLALCLLASPAAAGIAARTSAPPATEVAALSIRSDESLGALRAGRVESPAALRLDERAALRAAADRSPDLASLRAGQLTDREWTMIAIGAVIVLLIIIVA